MLFRVYAVQYLRVGGVGGGVKKGEEGKKGAGALVPAGETIPWGFLEFLGMKDVSGSPWLPRAGPEDTLSFWTPSSLDRVEVG